MDTLDIERDAKPLTDAEFERIDASVKRIIASCERAIFLATSIKEFFSGEKFNPKEPEFLKEICTVDRRISILRGAASSIVREWQICNGVSPKKRLKKQE